jgi:hypothetical protein
LLPGARAAAARGNGEKGDKSDKEQVISLKGANTVQAEFRFAACRPPPLPFCGVRFHGSEDAWGKTEP